MASHSQHLSRFEEMGDEVAHQLLGTWGRFLFSKDASPNFLS